MLDIKFVRENPDVVDKACESRQNAHWDREKFFELDEERRSVIAEVEKLQAERNSVSKQIGQLMREGKKDEAEAAKARVAANKDRIASLDDRRNEVEAALFDLVSRIPNIPHESVPYGKDDSDNPEVRRWGTPRDFSADGFEPKAHWDLGPATGMIDFDRGVKVAGTRFYVLGGMGARMERALISFMVDMHVKAGFKEWWMPVITNRETLFGTGQLPKFEDDLYHVNPDLYLIPTAEVMLTNLHRGEVLEASQLPLWYTAFTPCFREEAGSAGRDTRGIIRVHQFDKVKFAKPEDSMNQLESMVGEAEAVLQALGLPYHVVTLCTGDIGFSACKCYDLEVWLPSYGAYKEISSCSNCWDFQARRANIRYKDPAEFKGTRYVHTLNGSGLAVGRTMAAIMENYQNADGSITVPEALRPYMGGVEVIRPEA